MRTREELYYELCGRHWDTIEALLDEHAHALAEQIRANAVECYGEDKSTFYEGDAAMWAADLIDPEARPND